MTTSTDFVVNRNNLREGKFVDTALPALKPGQVLLQVDKFALTSNNITYGAAGDTIGYWKFFPAMEGWGRIPVWGYGVVMESKCDQLPVGERVYGYFPISTYLVVDPAKVTPMAFVDGAAHRAGLPPVYNQYQRVAGDSAYYAGRENEIALFRPLFSTSFLIDDFLAENDFFGGRNVVLASASSKTALGLAQLLYDHRKGQVKVVGLTSKANMPFVERTGYYDEAFGYDDVAKLDARVPTVLVDFAGNRKIVAAIHTHFGDQLRYSCIVGATHWENLAHGGSLAEAERVHLPGARPTLFFAPDRIVKRTADWGYPTLHKRIGDALTAFAASSKSWMRIVEGRGQNAIVKVYGDFIAGKTNPAEGHILVLWLATLGSP
ncbi:MAG: DUF2855 family protein [Alphaproteobacteria bacterium]|nr:DUF2855 family protein [Alphaproteobacteria bacterium]